MCVPPTVQLNTEKLEYNYRVLEERDHENQATISQQKRKIARLRDILSSLKAKYGDSDQTFSDENLKLTEEYKRITEQFKDLQGKYRHFEAADVRKYKEVWEMNEQQVAGLVRKVLQADRVLHAQQLGLTWHAPSEELFASPWAATTAATTDDADDAPLNEAETAEAQLQERLEDPRYGELLTLLTDEAGFLVDAKALKLLAGVPKAQGELMKVNNIIKALGVVDGPTFDTLVGCLTSGGGDGELVHANDAVARLRAFVEQEQRALNAQGGKALRLATASQRLELRRRAERDKEFWARMASVLSAKGHRVWRHLEKELLQYNKLVETRHGQLHEVLALQRQNDELRTLLNQYLSSKINEELVIPPTQVI